MKRILILLGVLFLTGCSKEIVCTTNSDEGGYKTETSITFECKGDKIINSNTSYIMTFNNEEETDIYLEMFQDLEDDYEVEKKNENQIQVNISKEYEDGNDDKDNVIKQFEKDGFVCE